MPRNLRVEMDSFLPFAFQITRNEVVYFSFVGHSSIRKNEPFHYVSFLAYLFSVTGRHGLCTFRKVSMRWIDSGIHTRTQNAPFSSENYVSLSIWTGRVFESSAMSHLWAPVSEKFQAVRQ